jgi:hypothetical protein
MAHAAARTVMGFSVARAALGLAEGGMFPAAIKTVAEWFPKEERALATGLFNAGSNIGAVACPLIVPWLATTWGWRSAFVATGAIGFVGWRRQKMYRPPEGIRRSRPRSWRTSAKTRPTRAGKFLLDCCGTGNWRSCRMGALAGLMVLLYGRPSFSICAMTWLTQRLRDDQVRRRLRGIGAVACGCSSSLERERRPRRALVCARLCAWRDPFVRTWVAVSCGLAPRRTAASRRTLHAGSTLSEAGVSRCRHRGLARAGRHVSRSGGAVLAYTHNNYIVLRDRLVPISRAGRHARAVRA